MGQYMSRRLGLGARRATVSVARSQGLVGSTQELAEEEKHSDTLVWLPCVLLAAYPTHSSPSLQPRSH